MSPNQLIPIKNPELGGGFGLTDGGNYHKAFKLIKSI
jgi:hypothetical protein